MLHTGTKRHDPLDDHGSSAPYPGYGGQGVRRSRQTDERPRSRRVAELKEGEICNRAQTLFENRREFLVLF